ncbi:MAG: pyridoxine 5'-phosphate synthase [Bacteroidales bacterium]|nr:pyridoxine 5'-phosphate synthase [Bacteroidales bacterium]
MTKLSVNINKVATIRNARGGNTPNVKQFAIDCERFGAQGITVHPRPDERHIRYADVYDIKPIVTTEFNIEGNPKGERRTENGERRANMPYGFIDLVKAIKPTQVTLVPDAEGVLTSNAGWDTVKNQDYLCDVVKEFKACGIRVSIFIDANPRMIEMAAKTGTDRVELYTESYASRYAAGREEAIKPFVEAAKVARECGLGLNAGHDLSLENLTYFHQQIPWVDEVSIGHALISDALYLGIEETIHRYLDCLK